MKKEVSLPHPLLLWCAAVGCHSFYISLEEGFDSVKKDGVTEKTIVQCDLLYPIHFFKNYILNVVQCV
jgi:hypothetical protein